MAKFVKVADLKDIKRLVINPLGTINEAVDKLSSQTEYFHLGDKVKLTPDLSKFDFRKNMTTNDVDEQMVETVKQDIGKVGEVTKIIKTENGTDWGKPSEIEVTLEDGRKFIYPVDFFKKIEE